MHSWTARRLYSSQEVFVVASSRTPVGSFRGALSSLSATSLGAITLRESLKRAGIPAEDVDEVIMGNVISANLGQAPARQACLEAGLPEKTICTTVNKVCSSGLKSITMAAQTIQLKQANVILAGGMESMSNAPYYLEKGRTGYGYGHGSVIDAIIKDGLWDPKYQIHMGECAEETAINYEISRSQQDEYAISSYKRAAEAVKNGIFKNEIVPIVVKNKKQEIVISEDEEFKKIDFSKVSGLKSAFKKDGTVTAANASTLNDGASSIMLASKEYVEAHSLKPIAKILSYADAECNPKLFTIAPSLSIPKALKRAGLGLNDVSLFEINEAFSVVALANLKILKLDHSKVNIAGGGVSLGHPIGSSGCRILVTLINLLKSGQVGCTGICNGGGGATSLVIQKL